MQSSSTLPIGKHYSRKENKRLKLKGLPYINRAGAKKPGKPLFSPTEACCKKQCFKKFQLMYKKIYTSHFVLKQVLIGKIRYCNMEFLYRQKNRLELRM